MSIVSILAPILGPLIKDNVGKVIDRFTTDATEKEKLQQEIEREIKLGLLEQQDDINKQAGDIILAEAKSSNWITSSWRPLLMLILVALIFVTYLVPSVAVLFGIEVTVMVIPDQLWNLLTLGVGGYVVGRSGEKMVSSYVGSKAPEQGGYRR